MLNNHSKFLEDLIDITSQIKNHVSKLLVLFQRIEKIIDKEHEAISKSDFNRVQELCADKISIADSFEEHVISIKNITSKILAIYTNIFTDDKSFNISNLSECIEALNRINNVLNTQGFSKQIFNHVLSSLNQNISNLIDIKKHIEPKIEINKQVLSKTLNNRLENYRFWQEINSEIMSSYNPKGYQEAKKVESIIQVTT